MIARREAISSYTGAAHDGPVALATVGGEGGATCARVRTSSSAELAAEPRAGTDGRAFVAVVTAATEGELAVPREIRRAHVTQIGKIGAGAFGDVWKGVLDESPVGGVPGFVVAIKTVESDHGEARAELAVAASPLAPDALPPPTWAQFWPGPSILRLAMMAGHIARGRLLGLAALRSCGRSRVGSWVAAPLSSSSTKRLEYTFPGKPSPGNCVYGGKQKQRGRWL